jgi:hypothetical protein
MKFIKYDNTNNTTKILFERDDFQELLKVISLWEKDAKFRTVVGEIIIYAKINNGIEVWCCEINYFVK